MDLKDESARHVGGSGCVSNDLERKLGGLQDTIVKKLGSACIECLRKRCSLFWQTVWDRCRCFEEGGQFRLSSRAGSSTEGGQCGFLRHVARVVGSVWYTTFFQ
jgi:hypothetical protein